MPASRRNTVTNTKANRPTVIPEPAQRGAAPANRGFDWNQLKGLYASGKAVAAGTTVITAQAKP